MIRAKWSFAAAILAIAMLAPPAGAVPLVLFNTGVATPGVLAPDGSVDTHYSITASPAGPASAFVVPDIPSAWIDNGPNSKWIAPVGGNDDAAAGNYTYRTTFTIPAGFDPATAVITGQWSTDNNGTDILINGTSTSATTPFTAFTSFFSFSISSGFVAGLNTLDFTLFNQSGPSGLRVELSGSVEPLQGEPVPEPGSFALVGLSICSVALLRRRQISDPTSN